MGKQENEQEYASLKGFFTVFVDRYVKADFVPPDERPLAVGGAGEEKQKQGPDRLAHGYQRLRGDVFRF